MQCTTCKKDFMPVMLRAEVNSLDKPQCIDCIKDERHYLEVTLLATLMEQGHKAGEARHIINAAKDLAHRK